MEQGSKGITVGQNEAEMRELAVQMMRSLYKAADNQACEFAKTGDQVMKQAAAASLAKAETWRQRARSHGAKV